MADSLTKGIEPEYGSGFNERLIGLLDSAHLTFEEIADEWKEARANQDKLLKIISY